MPVLRIKQETGWEDVAGASQHVHTTSDITDLTDFMTAVEELQTKVGDTTVSEQISNAIPFVTSADNGKFMTVIDGVWAAESIPNAEEGVF